MTTSGISSSTIPTSSTRIRSTKSVPATSMTTPNQLSRLAAIERTHDGNHRAISNRVVLYCLGPTIANSRHSVPTTRHNRIPSQFPPRCDCAIVLLYFHSLFPPFPPNLCLLLFVSQYSSPNTPFHVFPHMISPFCFLQLSVEWLMSSC